MTRLVDGTAINDARAMTEQLARSSNVELASPYDLSERRRCPSGSAQSRSSATPI